MENFWDILALALGKTEKWKMWKTLKSGWILHSKIYSNLQTVSNTKPLKKTKKTHWLSNLVPSVLSLHFPPERRPFRQPSTTSSAVGVNNAVPLQVVHQDEGLAAQRAAVRPLAAVRALVHPQAALLREPLAALAAAIRPLARVRAVVYAEVGRALEVLAAHAAPEGPLPAVALLVQLELVQAAELLAALRAHVGGAGGAWQGRLGLGVWEGSVPGLPPLRRLPCVPPLRIQLLLMLVPLQVSAMRLELTAVAAVTLLLPLLRAASLARAALRVRGEGVGILVHHAGEVGEPSIDVVAVDQRRP